MDLYRQWQILNVLKTSMSRAEGTNALQRLTKVQLLDVASQLEVIVPRCNKSELITRIINGTIGTRLKSEVFKSSRKN